MDIEKEFPGFDQPEVQDSQWHHAMSKDGQRYTNLEVRGKPGAFLAAVSGTERELGEPLVEKEFDSMPDGQKWLEDKFRKLLPKHKCNEHCWKGWHSLAELSGTPRGPVN